MNIVLIGMPGAGKSTLGVLLAKALGMDFTDTDILIQQAEGRLLQDIIDRDGIQKFMALEEKTISALTLDNCIIATGGSAVYSQRAMRSLKQNGTIVYLHVPFAEIEKRIINITTRGILLQNGTSLKDVYEERVPLYLQCSDIAVDCSGNDIEQCVWEIIAAFQAG